MQIQFTARHMELTDALKNYTESKISKLNRYIDAAIDANVTLSVEKYRHKAEVSIKGRRITVSAVEISGDMYQSIDRVFDKIEKQLRRRKDRRIAMRGNRVEENGILTAESFPDETDDSINAADIVKQELENVIVETEILETKPMTIEEALMQFEMRDSNFLVFRDAQSMQDVNVLYRRPDGKFGLIQTK